MDSTASRIATQIRDRIVKYVRIEIKTLLDAQVEHVPEIVEMAVYACLGSMIKSRYEHEKHMAAMEMANVKQRLAVERIITEEICKIAAARLEEADPGAKYGIYIAKRQRSTRSGKG